MLLREDFATIQMVTASSSGQAVQTEMLGHEDECEELLFFETSGTTCSVMQHHMPEDLNLL